MGMVKEIKKEYKSLKLTVVTVVYNECERIKDTIESVVGQDYCEIEYIIKDGGSTDGTLEIVEEYVSRDDRIKCVVGEDKGIYDAMNIGLEEATGDVIEFLNAGDRFASLDTVSKAIAVMSENGSDIVYGDVIYESPEGTTNIRTYPQSCSSRFYYLTGDCINHQVIFAKKELFIGSNFDTSFKICADREWMLRVGAYRPKCRMSALGFVVAIYPLDGASVINKELYKKEADICIKRYMPWGYPVYALFELFRSSRVLSGILHSLYERVYYKG